MKALTFKARDIPVMCDNVNLIKRLRPVEARGKITRGASGGLNLTFCSLEYLPVVIKKSNVSLIFQT